jgi:hypothetical protein
MKVMSHLKHQSAACLPPVQQYRTYTLDRNGCETASPQRLASAQQVAMRAFVLIYRQVGTSYENDYLTHLRERGLWPLRNNEGGKKGLG